jgi:hypothetical protein
MTRDLRKYAKQTNIRLIMGGIIILFVLGDTLIYIFYGLNAALLGLLCLVGGLAPVGLIILILAIIEWVVKRANPE